MNRTPVFFIYILFCKTFFMPNSLFRFLKKVKKDTRFKPHIPYPQRLFSKYRCCFEIIIFDCCRYLFLRLTKKITVIPAIKIRKMNRVGISTFRLLCLSLTFSLSAEILIYLNITTLSPDSVVIV